MTSQEFKDILYNGVWKQNTGVVQLLGMCPILAVSSSVVNGVSLGLATAGGDGTVGRGDRADPQPCPQ